MRLSFKIIRRFNLLAAGGLSGMYFWSHMHFLPEVKDKLQLKINGSPVPVPPKIKHLVYNVMKDMSLTSEDQSLIKIFVINEFNVQHFGYLSKKFPAFLGVPHHFVLEKIEDLDVIPLVNNTNINLNSWELQNFNNVLSLSMEAKKFAIAHELYEAQNILFYCLGLLPLAVIFPANFFSMIGEKLLNSSRIPLPYFHAFLFTMSIWVFILMNDVITTYKQAQADFSAARLGSSYVEGGIEYYEKMLKRNQLLKKLISSSPFTEEGEFKKVMKFRTLSMPYKSRITLLKKFKRNEISDEENLLKYVL